MLIKALKNDMIGVNAREEMTLFDDYWLELIELNGEKDSYSQLQMSRVKNFISLLLGLWQLALEGDNFDDDNNSISKQQFMDWTNYNVVLDHTSYGLYYLLLVWRKAYMSRGWEARKIGASGVSA